MAESKPSPHPSFKVCSLWLASYVSPTTNTQIKRRLKGEKVADFRT